ncbi:protein RIK [Amborella trichopoda]|uniref:Protein RIK n=1 Tax=Amborella trichopoda TaxID=13333 RepID=W1PIP9_AMBTC|nr:protein RIK [Amborella trichopoda]ERN07511.1 hypothetical protein AMTR_s00154p00021020 [Amborella trichopoda]|eukprot:XP_006845836.1 protein RIK [Amborella trichopoda]
MTEEACPKVTEESTPSATTKQRKKRKWDEPAVPFMSAGTPIPGVLPYSSVGAIPGVIVPSMDLFSGALLTAGNLVTSPNVSDIHPMPVVQQNAVSVLQKLDQDLATKGVVPLPKIQDELIAREIVINDAEPAVRYKLTKRQTQEEIQKCTGAVVITRGKYRPPGCLLDNDKPLYLHISAGAHLKDTAKRIKTVDRAAAMVEEIMKQGQIPQLFSNNFLPLTGTGVQVNKPFSACVFLGFEPNPSLNVAARIRGPSDQYINHIMNETGATVMLRGQGSDGVEGPYSEEPQQPLHLYLAGNTLKSLEDAKRLAENLLDTISVECGASRVSSSKVYNAVPPPQQLLTKIESALKEANGSANGPVGTTSLSTNLTTEPSISTANVPALPFSTSMGISTTCSQGPSLHQPGSAFNYGQRPIQSLSYPGPSLAGGTRYSGYEGIYPQATPLQQVALALRQPPAPASQLSSTSSTVSALPKMNSSSDCSAVNKQRRKFQELPVNPKGLTIAHQNSRQGSEFLKPGVSLEESITRSGQMIPPPKKLVQLETNGMPPPPPKSMPPPPPKFMPPPPEKEVVTSVSRPAGGNSVIAEPSLKLVEYGEEDEDDEVAEKPPIPSSTKPPSSKPFWAL